MPGDARRFGRSRIVIGPSSSTTTAPQRVLAFLRRQLQHRGLACLLAGLLVVASRLAMLPLIPIPVPQVHDEFSYLLGADTFASGRITNPPHPMWIHFETFHINMQPTYCSKYPPAQALFLAFGQRFLGGPWFGVVLSVGLMAAAFCWMLQGWLSPGYALLATLMTILDWVVSSGWNNGYWLNSYWGGAVPALGGALVIGAVPRIVRGIAVTPVLLASFGAALLANSRPYEGALTLVSCGAVLLWWMRREKRPLVSLLGRRVIIPLLIVALPVLAGMAYYNCRTTGNMTLFPYIVNQRAYAASPFMYVLPPTPAPVYRHEILRNVWLYWDRELYLTARANPLRSFLYSTHFMTPFYLLNMLGIAAVMGALLGGVAESMFAIAILSLPIVGLLIAKSVLPHYLAPASGALVILAGIALQTTRRWRFVLGGATGPILVTCALGISVLTSYKDITDLASQARRNPRGIATRPLLVDRLRRQGGRHLVIVRYRTDHDIHQDWVYNRADIDGSDIVWARDMGGEKNRELLDYYHDRKVWLLDPDVDPLSPASYARDQR
jgi:hypothetical protein